MIRVTGLPLAPFGRQQWMSWICAMLESVPTKNLGDAEPNVDLVLLRDGDMARLNAAHLGCPGPTNVLSFPAQGDGPGTLFLSVDTLKRECLLYGQEEGEHALRLLAHGLGHLLGHDHGSVMDALCETMMEAAQKQTMAMA